jgi:hypothetical protein
MSQSALQKSPMFCGSFHGPFSPRSPNLSPWQPSITRTSSPAPTHTKRRRRPRPRMSGVASSSSDTRWRTSAAPASCAHCWHKVSTWTQTTSRYCTGPGCTDIRLHCYPLADFLPCIESPHFKTRSLRLRVFFHSLIGGIVYWQKDLRRLLPPAALSASTLERGPHPGKKRGLCLGRVAGEKRASWGRGRDRWLFIPTPAAVTGRSTPSARPA